MTKTNFKMCVTTFMDHMNQTMSGYNFNAIMCRYNSTSGNTSRNTGSQLLTTSTH